MTEHLAKGPAILLLVSFDAFSYLLEPARHEGFVSQVDLRSDFLKDILYLEAILVFSLEFFFEFVAKYKVEFCVNGRSGVIFPVIFNSVGVFKLIS
jgi:hypothetical protein